MSRTYEYPQGKCYHRKSEYQSFTSSWSHGMWAHHHNSNCTYFPNCSVVISCFVSQLDLLLGSGAVPLYLPKFAMVCSIIVETRSESFCCSRMIPSMFLRTAQLTTVRPRLMIAFVSVCAQHRYTTSIVVKSWRGRRATACSVVCIGFVCVLSVNSW